MSQEQPAQSKAQVIKAPSDEAVKWPKTVFLAGTTTGPPDWRTGVCDQLSDLPITIFDPLRPDWTDSWTHDVFRHQVNWELSKQEEACVVAVYFGANTAAPISLMELGLCAKDKKAVVYVEDGYPKKGNVKVVCERYNIHVHDNFENFIQSIKTKLGV
ncbi:hypothetical protein PFICI_15122 [Pestalotiopsis fici W106-1]|uniref:Nucleoside 2-deoxyribosyltransferase n=1 Tax=Pestalotiopsis fici (strain W106-1 / CGMCC3.15140) TaxID=1229662 RepID=W3WJ50_PESFW|nr:uncharacterized protein PFICI_15122 [Pestalotiopsis fici W106-1]ETS73177.1 hypothetical protein PFICI_15122 [Pestalotiopsis fici W106-1]